MKRQWKSGRIEKILVFLICVWLKGWKNGGIQIFFFFFGLVEKRNGRI